MNILITGATSGIGRQLALDYAAEGNSVWGVGRNETALSQLEKEGVETIAADLTSPDSITKFQLIPSLDLAILNAGSCEYVDLPDFDSKLVMRVMRTNVDSLAISIEAVLPLLRKSSRPLLAGVASSAAYAPLPRAEAYGASKAAASYMLHSLRIDLARENIDVSVIYPGFVETPLTNKNDFPMPMRITVEEASHAIRKGLASRKPEIHFPKRFTYLLKLISFFPHGLWCRLAQRMTR